MGVFAYLPKKEKYLFLVFGILGDLKSGVI